MFVNLLAEFNPNNLNCDFEENKEKRFFHLYAGINNRMKEQEGELSYSILKH